MTRPERAATTLARALLLLYPSSFRQDVGGALVGDVRRRARELAGARLVFWMGRLALSLVVNAGAVWGGALIRGLATVSMFSWLDFKLAIRMLVKYPGLTLAAGLGLAVAVAVGVGFFALIQWRFYPVIPLSEGHRLVGLSHWDRRADTEAPRSLDDFKVWRGEMKSVEDMAAFRTVTRNVIGQDGSVELVQLAEITPSGFRLARVPPLMGRSLRDDDAAPGAAPVIVIGADVWRARFASAPDVVGRGIRIGGTVHGVVGVMPDSFAFPINHHYWIPLSTDPAQYATGHGPAIFVAGRLAPGFDMDGAQAELAVIGNRLAAERPATYGHLRPEVLPYAYINTGMTRRSASGAWAMSVFAGLLFVVVCVNVAILVHARTATRLGEIAVRSALGASRGRIVAQLVAESLVLAAVSGAVGLLAVNALFDRMAWQLRLALVVHEEFWQDYRLSASTLAYCAALTALAGVITGVIPAVRATGRRLQASLQPFNRGAGLRLGRTWTTLVVVQVAVASAILPVATALGLFQIRDAFRVFNFPVDEIVFASVALPLEQDSAADRARFARLRADLAATLDAEPGVMGHSFSLDPPALGTSGRVAIEHESAASQAEAIRDVQRSTVDLTFFRVFDVGRLAGRAFQSADLEEQSSDVVLVNRAFTSRVLGGGDPLGRRLRYVPERPQESSTPAAERWYEIVGVVENIDANPYDRDRVDSRVYHPMKNAGGIAAGLAVRVAGIQPSMFARRLRQIAAGLDPALTVDVVPLADLYRLLRLGLLTAAAAISVALLSVVLLSAAGVYALMSFTVTARRREIAIRTALGAPRGRLLGGILGRALRQISLGVAIGVALALGADASAQGEALGGHTGALLAAVVTLMSLVGLAATLGPARRGLRIEPSEALKG